MTAQETPVDIQTRNTTLLPYHHMANRVEKSPDFVIRLSVALSLYAMMDL